VRGVRKHNSLIQASTAKDELKAAKRRVQGSTFGVGESVGTEDGFAVGTEMGTSEGSRVGWPVGWWVGRGVGCETYTDKAGMM
jgi:hypothetical protein